MSSQKPPVYRSKPGAPFEPVRWMAQSDNIAEVRAWLNEYINGAEATHHADRMLYVKSEKYWHLVRDGEWIVLLDNGWFKVYDDATFKQKFELVPGNAPTGVYSLPGVSEDFYVLRGADGRFQIVPPGEDPQQYSEQGFLAVASFEYQVDAEQFIQKQLRVPEKQVIQRELDHRYGFKFNYNLIEIKLKKLAGETLEVLDAAYVNDGQNKAVKGLVKKIVRNTISYFWKESLSDGLVDVNEFSNVPDNVLD